MLYLLSLAVLIIAMVLTLLWNLRSGFKLIAIPIVVCLVACLYTGLTGAELDGATGADPRWTPVILFAGALSGLLALVLQFIKTVSVRRTSRDASDSPVRFAPWFWGLSFLSAAYLAWIPIDHWRFFRAGYETGTTRLIPLLSEVPCRTPLYRIEPSSAFAEYRCPTYIILNKGSQTPFVPWPNYRSGASQQLKTWVDQNSGSGLSPSRAARPPLSTAHPTS